MKINILLALIILFALSSNYAAPAQTQATDSLQNETKLSAEDSLARRRDSLGFAPVRSHGYISAFDTSGKNIRIADFQFLNYVQATDIIEEALPFFPLSSGSYGSFNHFSVYGALPGSTAVTLNGRQIVDLPFNSYQIDNYSPESFSEMQVYSGSDAAILGGASGALINLTERLHNSATPFTRIWYSQSAYNFTGADAIFTQNFAPKWNINLGFRNLSSDGRYDNSSMESWNVRGALRYSPDSTTTYSLSEQFVSRREGLWGGVDPSQSTDYYDPLSAVPRFATLDEKQIRHDFTLAVSKKYSENSILSGDVYFTNDYLLRNSGAGFYFNETDSNSVETAPSYYAGASARLEARLGGAFAYLIGGEAVYSKLPATSLWEGFSGPSAAGFARIALSPAELVTLSGGARIDYKYDKVAIAIGGKIAIKGANGSELYADASIAERLPSPAEGSAIAKESSLLTLLGWRNQDESISAEAFFRNVQNPIIGVSVPESYKISFSNGAAESFAGFDLSLKHTFWGKVYSKARLSSFITLENSKIINRYPYVSGDISAYYEYKIGRSALRGGLKVAFYSGFKPYSFNPLYKTYERDGFPEGFEGNGVDAFIGAVLGNAFVKVTYENLLSRGYYFVSVYPQPDRALKLSVAWSFFD